MYGCNLHCSWCDTAYTWADTDYKASLTESGKKYDRNDSELGLKEMSVHQVMTELNKLYPIWSKPTLIVISGGEPMLQQQELIPLLEALDNLHCDIHIETAGTRAVLHHFDKYVQQYNVSPKLEHSGNRPPLHYERELRSLIETYKAKFKFVCKDVTDVKEVAIIVNKLRIDRHDVQVMPEGTTGLKNIEVARGIADAAMKEGYGISLRNHVFLWPNDVNK